MSAASPIWRGYLAEIDCRWNVLCGMSDDRTAEERGFEVCSSLCLHRLAISVILASERRTSSHTKIALFDCRLLHITRRCRIQ